MADYTKSPVFSSPSYWIALGVGVVGIGAAAMQERTGSGSAAHVHRGSGVAYNVYLRGKHIDTVFQSGASTVDEVKRSLINHDGYDPAIRVTKAARSSGSGSMARITSVPKLIEALNARGFSFGKPNKTGSGTIQVGESKPYGAFFTVSHGRAFFHLLNNPVSIANVDDIINAIEANKRNSAELYKTGKISGSMADMHGSGGIGAAAMQERKGSGSMSRSSKLTQKRLDADEAMFNRRFGGLITNENGDNIQLSANDEDLEYYLDKHTLWTHVEGDGGTYLLPGLHRVNHIDYYISTRPWTDSDLNTVEIAWTK